MERKRENESILHYQLRNLITFRWNFKWRKLFSKPYKDYVTMEYRYYYVIPGLFTIGIQGKIMWELAWYSFLGSLEKIFHINLYKKDL